MPSKTESVRQSQKTHYETAVSERRKSLKEKGLDEVKIRKDPRIKQLLAKLRQITKALVAIKAKETKNEELIQRKKEKAEQKAEKPKKKGKSKKKAEKSADSGKKTKKKEKKKK